MHLLLCGLLLTFVFASAAEAARAPGASQVFRVKHYVSSDRVRVVAQFDRPVQYVGGTASNPFRIFFDLRGTWPAAALVSSVEVGDPILLRVRVGRNRPGITRMVLDLSRQVPYTATFQMDPPRLVIDVMRTGADPRPTTSPAAMASFSPPPAPVLPEQMPAQPPRVNYQNGQLTIIADNCTLSDVLHAVAARTGATIDAPSSLGEQRVAARLGPGPPGEVMAELLTGFNYIVVGADNNPQAIRTIIVTPSGPPVVPPPAPVASPEPAPPPPPPVEEAPALAGAEGTQPGSPPGGQPNQPQPQAKTPEELLEELRKLQQEQQQGKGSKP